MTHFVFILATLFAHPDLNKRYPFHFFSFCSLFLFLAFRFDYGNDYQSYSLIHKSINAGLSSWGQQDLLFKYFNLLIPNFYIFIALTSLIYIFAIYCLMKLNLKRCQYWIATALLLFNPYLFLVHLSTLRQTLAICCFIFAIIFIANGNQLMYIVCVFLGSGFHSSAILLLPLIFILNRKKLKKITIWVLILSLLLLITTPLFEQIIRYLSIFIPNQYMIYIKENLHNSIRSTIISSFFFFFILFNINKLENKELIYAKLSIIAATISILAIKLSMITRLGMYFDIFLIITIPHILSKMEKPLYRQVLLITIFLIFILRYCSFFNNPLWESFIHYKTILRI